MQNVFAIIANLNALLQPNTIFKGIFLFLILCHLIFMIVVLGQVRAMEKIITQPLSSAVLGFVCLLLIASSIGLFAVTLHLP